MRIKLNIFFIFLLLCITSFSQQSKYVFRELSTSDGLSQSSVIAIHQDQQGQMWFGTRDGLNLFNGANFKVFKNDPEDEGSISNSDILSLKEDSSGLLWIGTYNGLNSYDPKKEVFKKYYFEDTPSSLCSNTIWCIEEIDGEIWIGTSNGLSILNKKTGVFRNIFSEVDKNNTLPSNFVLKILKSKDGSIWIGTSKGLCSISKGKVKNTYAINRFAEDKSKIASKPLFVQTILEDKYQNLWIGTKSKGLYVLNRDTESLELVFENNQENDFRALAIDQLENIWVGTYSGIYIISDYRFAKKSTFFKIGDVNKSKIKTIYNDQKGSVWIGSYYDGVSIWDETNANFSKINKRNNQLSYNVVSSITADANENLYFGTEGGGISILDVAEKKVSFINTGNTEYFSTNNVKKLAFDKNDKLLIGTIGKGLLVYDISRKKILPNYFSKQLNEIVEGTSVYTIDLEGNDIFWIGTFGNGLVRYETQNNNIKHYVKHNGPFNSLTNDRIRSLLIDSQKRVWIGTQSGLNLIANSVHTEENIKYFFFDRNSVSGDDILTVFEDSNNQIWVGTKAKGLYFFDGNSFKKVPIIEGDFEITSIHSIMEDEKGFFWLSSNNGIVKYHPKTREIVLYNQSDGLISNYYNDNSCYRDAENQFYFGGPSGVSYFNPQKIVSNLYAPQVILTDFKIQNKKIDVSDDKDAILNESIYCTKEIELSHDKSNFSISFSIPSFINSTNNLFAYRLKGLEDEWKITSNTETSYTIQKAGRYVFEVKGANNDGLWNETPTALSIVILPAPWKSWWAYLLYILVIAFSFFGLLVFQKSKSKLKLRLDLEQLENEKIEEANRVKLEFFTNISHEFRTPLTLILGPLQQLLMDYSGSNQMHKKLLVIESSANHLLKLINRLMDFRKLENNQFNLKAAEGNFVNFLKEIYFSFSEYAKDGGYNYTFEAEQDHIDVFFDSAKLERVFYNLISNAFRFTPKNGSIAIKVATKEGQILISVEDNGVGIEEEFVDKIFDRFFELAIHNKSSENYSKGTGIGLSIVKNIVALHKGIIQVRNKTDKGVVFEVFLPLGKEHLSEEEVIENYKDSNDISQYVSQIESVEDNLEDAINDIREEENKFTVLIVEDHKPLRSFIKQLLKNEYKIIEAENGKIGLKMALQNIPDLIISDVIMPEMVGTEMCSKIKENIITSHIPVVLLTSRSSLIYKFEGLESGADEYISKPFNVKEFRLKVKNILESVQRLKTKFSIENNLTPGQIAVSSVDEDLLKKAFSVVEQNISNDDFDIHTFCSELGVSRTVLFTKIKAWTNFTPKDFILEIRLKTAARLLEQDKINISQISYKVGFKNPKYFSKCFAKKYGDSPTKYREKFHNNFS